MELPYMKEMAKGGFNYDNAIRNKALLASGTVKAASFNKTGTTIVASTFKVGVSFFCFLL